VDGSVIVAEGLDAGGNEVPVLYSPGTGFELLDLPSNSSFCRPFGISKHGRTVIAMAFQDSGSIAGRARIHRLSRGGGSRRYKHPVEQDSTKFGMTPNSFIIASYQEIGSGNTNEATRTMMIS